MSRIEEALEKAATLRASLPKTANLERVRPVEDTAARQQHSPQTEYVLPPAPVVEISNPYVVAATRPGSREAEEYRKLKSTIVALTRRDEFINLIMVTSSLGGEGKSITALNLAVTLAREYDHTVLLIDADLRKPSLHSYLGIEPKLGISDCLTKGIDVGEALVKTGVGKLTFLPAGGGIDNPSEMLSSQKVRDLILEMKHRYPDRYIIIDSPPVLPVSETRSIGALADGIIFVVKEGGASPDEVRDACGAFEKGKILGVVYNNARPSANGGYHYYDYGYGHQDSSAASGSETAGNGKGMFARIFSRSRR